MERLGLIEKIEYVMLDSTSNQRFKRVADLIECYLLRKGLYKKLVGV
jgi:hypothetical protein